MLTICKDKNGTELYVYCTPDYAEANPGGTICDVYIKDDSGLSLVKTYVINRLQYKELTLEGSIIKFFSEKCCVKQKQSRKKDCQT